MRMAYFFPEVFWLSVLLFAIAIAAASAASANNVLIQVPGPRVPVVTGHLCTVGDRHFDEFRYYERIAHCRRSVSSNTKTKLYNVYNIAQSDRKHYTIDHIIPLSIGGSNSVDNLWPEHIALKEHNGTLEWDLYVTLRDAEMTQAEAVWIVRFIKLDPRSPRYCKMFLGNLRLDYIMRP